MQQVNAHPSASPRSVSRRTVLGATVKLAYAVPVIVGSYHLDAMGRQTSAQALISGFEETATCTPTLGPTQTSVSGVDETPISQPEQTSSAGQTPASTPDIPVDEVQQTPTPTKSGSHGDDNDDDDLIELLTVKLLPDTGDGSSLPPLGASCP